MSSYNHTEDIPFWPHWKRHHIGIGMVFIAGGIALGVLFPYLDSALTASIFGWLPGSVAILFGIKTIIRPACQAQWIWSIFSEDRKVVPVKIQP